MDDVVRDFSERTEEFAIRIINLCEMLPKTYSGQTLGKQVFRSGTSVGAHYAEASHSRSRADFVSKIDVARQEMQETRYWLCLIAGSQKMDEEFMGSLLDEAHQMLAILITMSKNARDRSKDT